MLLTNFLIITGAQCTLNAKVIITVNFSTLSKTEHTIVAVMIPCYALLVRPQLLCLSFRD